MRDWTAPYSLMYLRGFVSSLMTMHNEKFNNQVEEGVAHAFNVVQEELENDRSPKLNDDPACSKEPKPLSMDNLVAAEIDRAILNSAYGELEAKKEGLVKQEGQSGSGCQNLSTGSGRQNWPIENELVRVVGQSLLFRRNGVDSMVYVPGDTDLLAALIKAAIADAYKLGWRAGQHEPATEETAVGQSYTYDRRNVNEVATRVLGIL